MNKLVEEIIKPILEANSNITKVIGVYGGRFQPFGPHHYKTYKWLTKQVDEAYISTSNIKKPPRHPMNFKEKVRHMSKMGVPANRIIEEKSPYVANNLAKKFNKDTTAFVYVFGAKDAGRLGGSGKYFQDFKKNKKNLKGFEEHGYYLVAPHVSISVGGKEVSGTTMRELLGSDKYDDKQRAKLFKKMFGYFNQGVFNMMVNKFKKLFEQDVIHTTWDNVKQKKLKKKFKDGKNKELIKGQVKEFTGGYPNKEDMKKIKKRVNKARNKSDSSKEYQYQPVKKESIELPIEIGDTIKMGRFKNKSVVVKSIDFNEKGDLLINGKSVMRFRIVKEFLSTIDFKKMIQEVTSTATDGGAIVDDGPTFGFGGVESYIDINDIVTKKLGYKIVDFIVKAPADSDDPYPEYDNDGAVSYGPAGVGTGRTPNNQVDLVGDKVWTAWEKYIDKLATKSGMEFVSYLLDKDILKQTSKDSKEMVKARNQENPAETPERKYIDEQILSEKVDSSDLLVVAKKLIKKYGVNVKIKLVTSLGSGEGDYAHFDFDRKVMKIAKKATKDLNEFLISVLHEIDHARDLKKMGRKFIEDYEYHSNMIAQGHVKGKKDPYWDNPYEIKAEKFGRSEAKKYNIKDLFGESLNEVSPKTRIFKQKLLRRGIKIRYDKAVAQKDLMTKYGGKGHVAAKKFGLRKAYYAVPSKDFKKDNKPTITINKKEMNKLHTDKQIDKGNLKLVYKEKLFSKDWWKKEILAEGGAYGHMAHPFDDKNLTFGDLKKIIELGLGGQLSREDNVTEKLDGQNIMVSWKDGKLIAARNKGHIKNGGKTALDTKGIISKFKGRGDIKDAFVFAMKDLERAIKSLSDKQKEKIFNNGYNFMNLEVMWPKSENVVNYDKAELVFHGALVYDDSGKVVGEVKGSGRILAGMIQQRNQNIQKKYKIGKPNFLQVPKHQDFSKMKSKFLGRLSKLQSKFGLKDNDTLGLYHQKWWEQFILKQLKKISPKVLEGLVKRWAFFDKSYKIPQIKQDLKDEPIFLEWVLKTDKENHANIVKENMKPFEELFFGVGAEILKNVKGFMAANPKKSVQSIRKKLNTSIENVKASGDKKKLNTLKLQLDKLNKIGGVDAIVPSEGIVFKYKGKTYKFTGAFAPINQITGLIYF